VGGGVKMKGEVHCSPSTRKLRQSSKGGRGGGSWHSSVSMGGKNGEAAQPRSRNNTRSPPRETSSQRSEAWCQLGGGAAGKVGGK